MDNYDWLGPEPEIRDSDISETVNTGLLIAGGGSAGLTAFATAAELGIDVTLIEKNGFCVPIRKEIGAVGSRLQIEQGADIDIQELARQHVMYSSGYADQRLILLWARESGEMIDWYTDLMEARGGKMTLQGGYGMEVKSGSYTRFPTGHKSVWPEHMSGVKVLTEYACGKGASLRMNTGLVKLIREGGRVIGAVAQDTKTGKFIRFNAEKGVMVATGGYSKNLDMLRALQPETLRLAGFSVSEGHTMGDGIKACLWAGAAMDIRHAANMFDRCAIMPAETPEEAAFSGHPTEFLGQPFLKVDATGRRFTNESEPYDFILHRALSLPGYSYFVIFDSGWYEDCERFDMAGCSRMFPFKNGAPCSRPIEENFAIIEAMVREGRVIRADSISELAEGLHLPADELQKTVARYNELFDMQRDEDFGKEPHRLSQLRRPPYYGARACGFLLNTLDGIRIDENMRALDDRNMPVEGLYPLGCDSGGFYANSYVNLETGGCAGRNMTFARHAVKHIAGII